MANNDTTYFNELLQKVRDIRSSERSAMGKIADVTALAVDRESHALAQTLIVVRGILQTQSYAELFANYLLLKVEMMASGNYVAYINTPPCYSAWTMSDVEHWAKAFVIKLRYSRESSSQLLFRYASYTGVLFSREGEEPNSSVRLPQELEAYKKNYVVLLVKDMMRLIERCSDISTDRSRPYDVMAELDRIVVECMPSGVFPANPVISTDEKKPPSVFRRFPFRFSHFEVDEQEPDPNFRTIYVVYVYCGM